VKLGKRRWNACEKVGGGGVKNKKSAKRIQSCGPAFTQRGSDGCQSVCGGRLNKNKEEKGGAEGDKRSNQESKGEKMFPGLGSIRWGPSTKSNETASESKDGVEEKVCQRKNLKKKRKKESHMKFES